MTAPAPFKPRRSALFLPASNARAIAKSRTLDCDIVILDLEDAVAPEAKDDARAAALAALAEGGFGHREVAVRCNGLDTPWGAADLAALSGSSANAVLVPKVNGPADIEQYNAALQDAPAPLELWAMIETCASVLSLEAIAATAASTRLALWVMGTNDLAKEMRAPLTPERTPFLPFFSMAVAAARIHGLSILDSVCNEFRDIDAFTREAQQGRMYGFDGKSLIHPAQIAPCNAAHSPDAAAIAHARAVLAAFALPENRDKGAINVDGQMVERLHLEQAELLLRMAESIAA